MYDVSKVIKGERVEFKEPDQNSMRLSVEKRG